ncbi:MAG TPA: cation:proton antiporter [candidate division WOR-3 bacterium]|uniref:Cation:proton antiporter n=1 Tax=candidate division WOR-3 bacterium TaxID=2052148 RepID=A0A9C9EMM4_UNCW3|nr:cation:proton antiporter [candidate division WOR-3 bacterium]
MLNTLLSLGLILTIGLIGARLFKKLKFPSVTAYIVFGIILGPHILKLIAEDVLNSTTFISNIALGLIAVSLGQNFTITKLRRIGKSVLAISLGEVIGSFSLVFFFLFFIIKTPLPIALILAAIAPATAPAAVVMVTREYRAKGPFTDTLLGVVAIDDAWGIILFAFCLALAKSFASAHIGIFANIFSDVVHGFWEVLGGLGLGISLGFVYSYFLKYLRTSSNILIYTLGIILINSGLSIMLNVSLLLANMFFGAVIANRIKLCDEIFEILKKFDPPLYLLFFVLAGASLEIPNIPALGLIGIVYVLTRLPGEMLGAFSGAYLAKASKKIKKYLGLGLAPQAGVAIGLALVAKTYFTNSIGDTILSTIIVTTVIYELIGPFFVKIALEKAGEVGKSPHEY